MGSAHNLETGSRTATPDVVNGLHWVASPACIAMAMVTGLGGRSSNLLCSAVHGAPVLGGMATMYALMAVVHSGPWLKVLARRLGRVVG